MKWRWLFILALPVLAGLLPACTGSRQSGLTAVTITIGSRKASSKSAFRSPVVSKATPTVVSIAFTISGSGMDRVSRTIAITPPQTVTEVFNVLTGPARTILIEAKDGSGNVVYRGSTTMDLNGTPVTLTLPLQTMIFNRLITSPWNDESTATSRAANGDLLVAGHTLGDLEVPLHLRFRDRGSTFRVQRSPFSVQRSGFNVRGSAISVQGLSFPFNPEPLNLEPRTLEP